MPSVTLHLDPGACGLIRLTTSPLWETVSSLMLQTHAQDSLPWPYNAWHRSVADDVRHECAELVDWVRAAEAHSVARLLLSIPSPPMPDIEAQLTELARQSPDRLARQLEADSGDVAPRCLTELGASTGRSLAWLAAALEQYWSVALARYWPAMQRALEEEILVRSQTLAVYGPDALLSSLHERVHWDRPLLSVSGLNGKSFTIKSEPVAVVPMVFGRAFVVAADEPGGGIALSYQARGAAVLADRAAQVPVPRPSDAVDTLVVLIGHSRATVLRSLRLPTTTTALSHSLGLAASTVSAHLASLNSADVVRRRRVGGRVLYELTPAGLRLLALDAAPG